jgi:exodeoxyribonuclease V alpha subunit
MKTINDIHQRFAAFFKNDALAPYAYMVSKKLTEGHICIALPLDSESLPEFFTEGIERSGDDVAAGNNQFVCTYENDQYLPSKQPFVICNDRLYLQRYFAYETLILQRINSFLITEAEAFYSRKQQLQAHADFIKALFAPGGQSKENLPQSDWQLAAAMTGMLNNFTIITGGPGTGKTTTVAKILAILYKLNPDLKVVLAAPTGKASARIAESIKNAKLPVDEEISNRFKTLEPFTIHRLLKQIKDTPHFKHNHTNPINADVVIVDESSMIDVSLFAKLMDAIGPNTRLILLGDKDQLASVEAGSIFGDLCNAQSKLNLFSQEKLDLINQFISEPWQKIQQDNLCNAASHPLSQHVIELRHSHRFSDEEGIGRISKAVINNNVPVIESFFSPHADDKVLIDFAYDEKLLNEFVAGYASYINEPDISLALKKMNDLKVLCAVREGSQGLHALNKRVEDQLTRLGYIKRTGEFYENRPIMVTANNYELGLFNGDVGIMRKNEQGIMMAWFEDSNGERRQILPGYIAAMETVFAMTIHKSQGSEFKHVLITLPQRENINILTRELLYTGITRAKEKVIIQASAEGILKAAEANLERVSGVSQRFTASLTEKQTN